MEPFLGYTYEAGLLFTVGMPHKSLDQHLSSNSATALVKVGKIPVHTHFKYICVKFYMLIYKNKKYESVTWTRNLHDL